MSYHLDAWVAKKDELDALGINCVALAQGFGLTTNKPELFPNKIAWLHASFFGGGGEQEATFYERSEDTMGQESFGPDYYAINQALAKLGVVKESGKDEFDTLGLGRHRDNDWGTEPDQFAFEGEFDDGSDRYAPDYMDDDF